ncbi:Hypothetical_protein [Hexamita inflata]|uniref:Hypothetical_protein n=1 Tax=Hexamita inflata TaxID=28002 RepID=A0AA86QT47_9EUKA|nr:Hypothetical protein HINF_LOCUS48716 [Hexamita inflata]
MLLFSATLWIEFDSISGMQIFQIQLLSYLAFRFSTTVLLTESLSPMLSVVGSLDGAMTIFREMSLMFPLLIRTSDSYLVMVSLGSATAIRRVSPSKSSFLSSVLQAKWGSWKCWPQRGSVKPAPGFRESSYSPVASTRISSKECWDTKSASSSASPQYCLYWRFPKICFTCSISPKATPALTFMSRHFAMTWAPEHSCSAWSNFFWMVDTSSDTKNWKVLEDTVTKDTLYSRHSCSMSLVNCTSLSISGLKLMRIEAIIVVNISWTFIWPISCWQ